jgi:hypothetical protein
VQLLALGKEEASYAKQQMVCSTPDHQELGKRIQQQQSMLDCPALPCSRQPFQSTCMQADIQNAASHDAGLKRTHVLGLSSWQVLPRTEGAGQYDKSGKSTPLNHEAAP